MVVKAEPSTAGSSIKKVTLSTRILPIRFVPPQENTNVPTNLGALPQPESELFSKIKKKIIINFLPVIILDHGLQATIVSPKLISLYIKKKFFIDLSAGTVYPVFKSLEVDGYIVRLPNKTNRIYSLTLEGRQSIEYFIVNLPLFNSILYQAIK
jgi:hypothetical protein